MSSLSRAPTGSNPSGSKKCARKVTDRFVANVYRGMNTTPKFDWSGQIRLGLILSVATALAAFLLGGHVDETTFIVTVIVISSFASWTRVPRIASHRGVNTVHQTHRLRRGYCRREQVTLHRVAAHRA